MSAGVSVSHAFLGTNISTKKIIFIVKLLTAVAEYRVLNKTNYRCLKSSINNIDYFINTNVKFKL